MVRTMSGPSELWRMRKQFALQTAANSFLTYAFAFASRIPTRFNISRNTGLVAMGEMLPGMYMDRLLQPCASNLRYIKGQSVQQPICVTGELVPFRLTPNMQHFIGPVFTEGILASGIMTIARCLSEPEVS